MFKNNPFKQKSPQKRFLLILGLAMFAFYLVMGVYVIMWTDFPWRLQPHWRISLGVLLIVYAFIRFTRLMSTNDE
ncbi:hypothetical protein [Pedobacter sp. SYP-B3415]|uniref:hypothetical protein n=1 Tax=Pedobacter sp. SYP-B3415 TaxID=2496641 RepID=UPI00101DE3A2|nr:hypothetical protein [Pedobacter sp. SYP-B3415]